MASALLEDGWFAYKVTGLKPPFFADEYLASIGNAEEPPPRKPSTSGIWIRRYSGGAVLVNPTEQPAEIDIGPGYKRLTGSQDSAANSGALVRKITLQPKDGLILLKE
jgi:hypothetical protein